jgi:hypothetical protein
MRSATLKEANMSKPLMLSIGGRPPEEANTAAPDQPQSAQMGGAAAAGAPEPSTESLAEIYQTLKRHEETLRDLIVEVRLLYHNLSEKEKQRLESRREPVTRQAQEAFAGQIRALEEKIARLGSIESPGNLHK